jgi:MSHA biogenesis protein MshN
VAQEDKKPAVAKPKPTPVIETVEIPVARVSKNRNKVAADQKAYRAGLKQLQGGHWVAAEAGFKQALSLNPELLDARLKLIRLYQQQAEFEQAEKLLREGLSLVPGDFVLRKILARQLFNDQRLGEAIELLEIQPQPGIGKDLEYHALLAALLQEAGRFDDARLLYSKLVQIRPQAALWWMGLAISLDQTDHPSSARDAYQRALVLPGLRPDLQDYIHNRLQVL